MHRGCNSYKVRSLGGEAIFVIQNIIKSGFKCFYLFFSACNGGDCPTGTSGELKSFNYPLNYDNNMDVTFPLEVASGWAIELTFTDIFDIEPHGSCDYDYVQV